MYSLLYELCVLLPHASQGPGEVYSLLHELRARLPALPGFLLLYGPGELYSLLHALCAHSLPYLCSSSLTAMARCTLLHVPCPPPPQPSPPYLSSSSPMVQARCTLSCMYCVTSSPPSLQSRLSLKLHFSTGTGTLQMI